MSPIEDLVYVIGIQADILDGTELTKRAFDVLLKCYEALTDLEMELDEG